jgi:hypothetical protein
MKGSWFRFLFEELILLNAAELLGSFSSVSLTGA